MSFGDPWFYIVLIGIAAVIYSFLLPGRNTTAAGTKNNVAIELETTLEQYMAEIEKENKELIDLVTQMKQDFTTKQLVVQEQVSELRGRMVEVEHSTHQSESRLGILETGSRNLTESAVTTHLSTQEDKLINRLAEIEVAAEVTPVISDIPDPAPEVKETIHDRYAELFAMYESGRSIDMIAKSIGMQRGEVQLILQLAKREESR